MMKFYNIKEYNKQVSFAQAINQGLGRRRGCFPMELPEFALTEIDELLEMDFVSRSARILSAYIGDMHCRRNAYWRAHTGVVQR